MRDEAGRRRDRWWRREGEETLLELANLSDSDSSRFMRRIGIANYYRDSFYVSPIVYRDQLRKIWSGDVDAMRQTLNVWLRQIENRPNWLVVEITEKGRRSWSVVPRDDLFPLALALYVRDLRPRMAVCGNPKCPNPHFLRGRKTQRFCDRPACIAYGQREHKRKWWSEHGAQWKQKRRGRLRRNRRK